jgi:molybdenum cofactor guanylyltransferase
MTGIILSGGENRRMGADKAFLEIAGIPMIEHVVNALRSVTGQIIIVTNSPEKYAFEDVQVVTDAYDSRGPLTGIYSGLQHSSDEHNFIVACDMPFLNPRLISFMAGLADEYDVVLPKIGEFVEPLHAVYRKSLLPIIKDRIERSEKPIRGIFNEARVRYVTEAEIDRFDPAKVSFKNINTPAEYKEAACLDLECRSY